jgi:triacylglycerol lipase
MESLPPNLDPARALLLARASRAAYFDDPAEIATVLARSNVLGQIEPFAAGDTEGFLFTDEDQLVVSFRGSVTVNDWINNATVELVGWAAEGRIHAGFMEALNAVWEQLVPTINERAKGRTVWFTGHSLGGALALLGMMRWRVEHERRVDGLYTFGMPKVGDETFAAAVEENHGPQAFTFLNEGDFVPWLPVFPAEFSVACTGLHFTKQGKLQPRPGALGAALLMLSGMLGKSQEEWMNLKVHHKEEYLRLVENAFGP